MLDVHVVIPEVDWTSRELLAIECHVDGVLEDFWVKVVQMRDLRNDLAIFKVAFSRHPDVLIVLGAASTAHFGAATLSALTGFLATLQTAMVHTHLI